VTCDNAKGGVAEADAEWIRLEHERLLLSPIVNGCQCQRVEF
jgi:hypothetical protein